MKLILTESDLSTITNALCIARDSCRSIAENTAQDPVDKIVFEQSATQYGELCDKIEEADEIEVEL